MTATSYFTGGDADGSDGAKNRILLVDNTSLTIAGGFEVFIAGVAQSLTTDYTIVHNVAGSAITFLNNLFDASPIIVVFDTVDTTSTLSSSTSYFTGTDASGSTGAKNRVITLDNTELTVQGGFEVFASGIAQSLFTDYTVVHNTTGSLITFLNNLFNDSPIIVVFNSTALATSSTSSKGISVNDFKNGPLQQFGRTFNLIKVSDTLDSMGAKTAAAEVSTSITGVVQFITEKNRDLLSQGLAKIGDARFFVAGDVDLDEGDIIENPANSKRWRVERILGNRNTEATTIFISAIIRNIGLES